MKAKCHNIMLKIVIRQLSVKKYLIWCSMKFASGQINQGCQAADIASQANCAVNVAENSLFAPKAHHV